MYYKYEIEKQQVSYDSGITWIDTYVTRRSSNYVASYDTLSECETGIVPQYRTVSGSPYCDGYTKKEDILYQVSYDNGVTWEDVSSSTTILELESIDCGAPMHRTVSGSPYCDGYNKVEDIFYQESYDRGVTWEDVSSSTTVIEYNSTDCGYSPIDYSTHYLTIESLEDNNTVYFKVSSTGLTKTISASTDGGNTWTAYTSSSGGSGTTIATLNSGEKVLLKGVNSSYYSNNNNYSYFLSSKNFNIYGNIMSLISGDTFANANVLTANYALSRLFWQCSTLISAENLIMPATTLTNNCYQNMFYGCGGLTTALSVLPATTLADNCYSNMFAYCTGLTETPQLPATTLANNCYSSMFAYCSSLTTTPALPSTTLVESCYDSMFYGCTSLTTTSRLSATTMADYCYRSMFYGCTSLTTSPALPATTLAYNCYQSMFSGCTSLTTAPELPATTLIYGCYWSMFGNCTSLTTAPELPATTLANYCYCTMFKGCSSLNSITCLATSISASQAIMDWVQGVASSGTFTKAASMNNWSTGTSGIPENWTVQNA